jgi:hypothetical protein
MEDLIMSNVEKMQEAQPQVRIEEPKEGFVKKAKRKTLNFLSQNGVWIGAVGTGVAVGYLAGKHNNKKKSIVVSQEALEAPKAVLEEYQEYYQQEVDADTEVQDLEDFGQDEYASESVE